MLGVTQILLILLVGFLLFGDVKGRLRELRKVIEDNKSK